MGKLQLQPRTNNLFCHIDLWLVFGADSDPGADPRIADFLNIISHDCQ